MIPCPNVIARKDSRYTPNPNTKCGYREDSDKDVICNGYGHLRAHHAQAVAEAAKTTSTSARGAVPPPQGTKFQRGAKPVRGRSASPARPKAKPAPKRHIVGKKAMPKKLGARKPERSRVANEAKDTAGVGAFSDDQGGDEGGE